MLNLNIRHAVHQNCQKHTLVQINNVNKNFFVKATIKSIFFILGLEMY